MRRAIVVAAVVAAVAAGVAAAAMHASAPATRTVLAEAPAQGAPGRLLGLSVVLIPPGTLIAKHHHPGTQVATIAAGRLTYTVFTGAVPVYRSSSAGTNLSRTIRAGHTAVLRPGDTLIEQPGVVHQAENRGGTTVRVVLASLFPKGAPSSVPVK
jgi:quercetin dioxygenase-like cupin family protein